MSLFTRNGPVVGPDAPHDAPEHEREHGGQDGDDEKTVRLARRRFTRRQWARRWLAWRRVVVTLLLLALLVAAGWLVFFSPVLAVSGVQVNGTRVLDPVVVRREAEVPRGTPVATVDLDAITRRVERLPAVRSVDVSRSWPDHVRVDVTERQAVAVVQTQGPTSPLRGVDAQGVLFRQFATRPKALPMIRMGETTGSDALAEAATVAGSLPADLARRVGYVEVRTVDTISLELRSGKTVRWGSADESADKARVLDRLLDLTTSYIDVSVPGQPVIRR